MPEHNRRSLAAALLLGLVLAAARPGNGMAAMELIMVERADCPACLRWQREVGHVWPRTAEAGRAPLRRVRIGGNTGVALAEPVLYTPTFILAADGRERGRITGYQDDASFWGLLTMLLDRMETE